MDQNMREGKSARRDGMPRREFLRVSRGIAAGGAMVPWLVLGAGSAAMPVSEGYLVVDYKKCQGCLSCMMACSLVHHGEASLSRARIQVVQNSFEKWPDDVSIDQCRQCADPECVKACPTEALFVDGKNGNVRRIDPKKCDGCGICFEKCPFNARRVVSIPDKGNAAGIRMEKCDLCATAPHHWSKKKGGGPKGKQACVSVCPVGAIAFTSELPEQDGDEGYLVNLRDENWESLGFPVD